jgi:hypothetical protein
MRAFRATKDVQAVLYDVYIVSEISLRLRQQVVTYIITSSLESC